ncbi:hypothetical protein BDB00DRAFT_762706, partial [Zychaea mexicana]|uniref:uncharacterized protein n=1 Tax=Zychaea mexicana TaxID=64656 RepID=UPI0022FDD39A
MDFFLSTHHCINPRLEIRSDLSLDSYHKLLHFSFTLEPTTNPVNNLAHQRRLWKLSKLKDTNTRQRYLATFTDNIQSLSTEAQHHVSRILDPTPDSHASGDERTQTEIIEHLTSQFYDKLYTTMDDTLGATPGGQHRRDSFWTAELQRLNDHRELCYRKWRRAIGMNKLTWWIRHQEARARVRRAISKRSRETWLMFCNKLESDDYRKTTASIKKIRQRRTIQPTFSHPEGPQAAAETMATHLESVFDG